MHQCSTSGVQQQKIVQKRLFLGCRGHGTLLSSVQPKVSTIPRVQELVDGGSQQ